jgi:hypothetical protein
MDEQSGSQPWSLLRSTSFHRRQILMIRSSDTLYPTAWPTPILGPVEVHVTLK